MTWPRPNSHIAKGRRDDFGDRNAPIFSSTPYGDAKNSANVFKDFCCIVFGWRLKSVRTDWRVKLQAIHAPI